MIEETTEYELIKSWRKGGSWMVPVSRQTRITLTNLKGAGMNENTPTLEDRIKALQTAKRRIAAIYRRLEKISAEKHMLELEILQIKEQL